MKLAKSRRNVRLALLRVLILGVLGEIAMRASDLDFLGKLVVQFVLEDVRFHP